MQLISNLILKITRFLLLGKKSDVSCKAAIVFKKWKMRFPPTECLIDRHHLLIFLALFSLNEEDEQAAVVLGCGLPVARCS